MIRRTLALAGALIVLALAAVYPPTPTPAPVADEWWRAVPGGAYACNALRYFPDATRSEVTAWVADRPTISAREAADAVAVAVSRGCQA